MDKEYFLAKIGKFYDLSNIKKNSKKEKCINNLYLKAKFGTFEIIERKRLPVAFKEVETKNGAILGIRSTFCTFLIKFSIDEMRDFTIRKILKVQT